MHTNVPNIRVAYRMETLQEELDMVADCAVHEKNVEGVMINITNAGDGTSAVFAILTRISTDCEQWRCSRCVLSQQSARTETKIRYETTR